MPDAIPHGTLSRYTRGRCRCEACRAANAEYHRAWREANREKARSYSNKWTAANRERAKQRTQQWREANPGKSAGISKRWREANPERARAMSIAWNRAHPETMRSVSVRYRAGHRKEIAARTRAWYAANLDRANATSRAWRIANADIVRFNNARRRAREQAAETCQVTRQEWLRLVRRYDECCAYCGANELLTQDHVVPLSRGGRHAIGNLLPACGTCNSSKGARLLMEWRLSREV